MSIEKDLSAIALALTRIADHLSATPSAPLVAAPAAPTVSPVAPTSAPLPPVVTAVTPVAPPLAPPVALSSAAPFTDAKGMIAYVMASYQALGPKGQAIQGVLSSLGVTNINEVRPDQYAALYAGVEALK